MMAVSTGCHPTAPELRRACLQVHQMPNIITTKIFIPHPPHFKKTASSRNRDFPLCRKRALGCCSARPLLRKARWRRRSPRRRSLSKSQRWRCCCLTLPLKTVLPPDSAAVFDLSLGVVRSGALCRRGLDPSRFGPQIDPRARAWEGRHDDCFRRTSSSSTRRQSAQL